MYQRLEADALAGAPKGNDHAQRCGRRHGYEVGSVVMGGVRIAILRPSASLREGLEKSLTCQRLQLPERLRRSLRSTNIIESIFARHEEVAHRVKRWCDGFQALRWAAASLLRAEKALRPLPAATGLPRLAAALEQHFRGQSASQAA